MVSVDNDTKKIIKAIIHSDEKRKKRKKAGSQTAFDALADNAIKEAKAQLLEGVDDKEIRKHIVNKIHQSLLYNTPWECLGETYCCRRLFYEYRTEYIKLISVNMISILETWKEKEGQK